jgi:hypothetical protein
MILSRYRDSVADGHHLLTGGNVRRFLMSEMACCLRAFTQLTLMAPFLLSQSGGDSSRRFEKVGGRPKRMP